MPADLVSQSCAPCHGETAPLKGSALGAYAARLPGWEIVDEHHLRREYRFPDFAHALAFVNRIGAIAEKEQHHPDVSLGWGRVEVTTFTHSIQGLSVNDFILAAKIEAANQKSAIS